MMFQYLYTPVLQPFLELDVDNRTNEQEDSYMVSMMMEMRHLKMRDRLRRGRG